VVNAVMLKAQLGQPIDGGYPPEMLTQYPELQSLVTSQRTPMPQAFTSPVRSRGE
jgi:hypothetical protein